MINKILLVLIFPSILFSFSGVSINKPEPFGPVPSENQMRWQEMEYYAFLHFSMNTFTDQEWGYGDEDLKLFNPGRQNTQSIRLKTLPGRMARVRFLGKC